MHASPAQLLKIVALSLAAVVLGVVLLLVDQDRRAGDAVATAATAPAPAMEPMRRADAERLVANAASATGGGATDADPVAATPDSDVAPSETTAPVALEKRGGVVCGQPHRTIEVPRSVSARATPGGREIGVLPAQSKYLGSSTRAWVQAVSPDGAWGKVTIPWSKPVNRAAWVPLGVGAQSSTKVMVVGDVSDRTLRVYRGCALQLEAPMAVGAPGSPSPLGRFWVTDRVAVPRSQPYFGSYAFGLSTIQPDPPAGWTGGNQMAIHGTNTPGSIGTAASAGCLRVAEGTLARLRTMVGIGTPVIIQR